MYPAFVPFSADLITNNVEKFLISELDS
jgi:hypothetical protein